jgi:hypothetical protein
MDLLKPFDIIHNEAELHVVPKKIGVDTVYMIHFPSRRPPIMLTKATKQGGTPFWTTIPEEKEKSRQDTALAEAAQFGALISSHYHKLLPE